MRHEGVKCAPSHEVTQFRAFSICAQLFVFKYCAHATFIGALVPVSQMFRNFYCIEMVFGDHMIAKHCFCFINIYRIYDYICPITLIFGSHAELEQQQDFQLAHRCRNYKIDTNQLNSPSFILSHFCLYC